MTLQMMRLEWRRNPIGAARYLGPLLQARAVGVLAPADQAALQHLLVWYGRADDLAEVGPQATEEATPSRWMNLHRPQHADPEVADPEVLADAIVKPASATDRARVLLVRSATARAVTAAERLLKWGHFEDDNVDELFVSLTALLHADLADRAVELCDDLTRGGCFEHAPTWHVLLQMIRAEGALRLGNLTGALTGTRAALDVLPAEGWGVAIGGLLATAVMATTAMGDHEAAAEYLRVPAPCGMFDTLFGQQYLIAMGHHELALGHPDMALAAFQRCGETLESWGVDLPGVIPWRSGAAQAQLMLGQWEVANQRARIQLERVGGAGPRTRGAALRGLAATLPPQHRFPLLHEAVELLHQSGDRLTLAGTLLDLSQAFRVVDDEDKARAVAQRAMLLAQECDASPLAGDPLLAERANTPVPPARRSSEHRLLSDAENRVAHLAAQGYTNREISGRLFITVSTVEQHLTRIYRKLHVSRRADLRSRMPVALEAS